MSVYIERITQMSSMQPADVREQLADLDAALAVLGRTVNGEGMQLAAACARPVHEPTPAGAWPSYLSRAGLGSNVSTCDGPPFMNRKMTRLARAGKSGALGASGIVGGAWPRRRQEAVAGQHARQAEGAEAAADLAEQLAAGHPLLRWEKHGRGPQSAVRGSSYPPAMPLSLHRNRSSGTIQHYSHGPPV